MVANRATTAGLDAVLVRSAGNAAEQTIKLISITRLTETSSKRDPVSPPPQSRIPTIPTEAREIFSSTTRQPSAGSGPRSSLGKSRDRCERGSLILKRWMPGL